MRATILAAIIADQGAPWFGFTIAFVALADFFRPLLRRLKRRWDAFTATRAGQVILACGLAVGSLASTALILCVAYRFGLLDR